MLKKKRNLKKSKKGLSIMIGYVLLVSFAIIMSVVVYQWIKTYVPKDPLQCPDGVSVFIKEIDCNNKNFTITIKNNGRFNIAGYFIRATNDSSQEVATIDFSPKLISGGNNITNAILFSGMDENPIEPGDEKSSMFSITQQNIYSLEIIPVRYQEVENRMRFVQCGDARVKQENACVINPLDIEGIISWWRFEGNALDATGRNNGTLMGGIDCTSPGISGSACSFTGSPNYIEVNDSDSLDVTGAITIAMWVNVFSGGSSAVDTILHKGEGTGYMLEATDNNRCSGDYFNLQYGNSGNTGLCSITKVKRDNWQHIAVTYNLSTALFYVDGVFNSSAQKVASTTANSLKLLFGYTGSGGGSYFRGKIDELMLFNRSLSEIEIRRIYDYF